GHLAGPGKPSDLGKPCGLGKSSLALVTPLRLGSPAWEAFWPGLWPGEAPGSLEVSRHVKLLTPCGNHLPSWETISGTSLWPWEASGL
ncbi:hypothetical protein AVEN_246013-1, partial [Araneus ventricosus]